jgi:hypothetical protein
MKAVELDAFKKNSISQPHLSGQLDWRLKFIREFSNRVSADI